MNFEFRQACQNEQEVAFILLKEAAQTLQSKKIDQWKFWLNPSTEKTKWIKEGFAKKEFYFITISDEIIGMFRLLDKDPLYWGEAKAKAKYIHSLVIRKKYSGNQIGKKVLDKIMLQTINQSIFLLRLDCNAANEKLCNYYESQGFIKVRQKCMPHSINNLYQKKLLINS